MSFVDRLLARRGLFGTHSIAEGFLEEDNAALLEGVGSFCEADEMDLIWHFPPLFGVHKGLSPCTKLVQVNPPIYKQPFGVFGHDTHL